MEAKAFRTKLQQDRQKTEARPYTLTVCGKRITLSRPNGRFGVKPKNTRGPIVTFSRKARARQLRKIAEIDWQAAGPGLFFTVTYPDECAFHTMKERAKHRYLIHRHIEHEIGDHVGLAWRVEWLPRKSGSNVGTILPHMHFLLFTDGGLDTHDLRKVWMRTIGAKRHTQIDLQRVSLGDMVSVYAAKYCTKASDASILDNVPYHNRTGRHAGWLRENTIPRHPKEVYENVSKAIVLAMRRRACETLWWYDPRFDEGFSIIGDAAIDVIREFYGITVDSIGELPYTL